MSKPFPAANRTESSCLNFSPRSNIASKLANNASHKRDEHTSTMPKTLADRFVDSPIENMTIPDVSPVQLQREGLAEVDAAYGHGRDDVGLDVAGVFFGGTPQM
eukprot:454294_1